jgi:ankyrin repeat protein
MIQACIESGASFSQSLQIAVGNNCIPAIKMLVKAGVDLNERDEYGDMSLDYVVGTGYPGEEAEKARATYDLLIKLGAVEN